MPYGILYDSIHNELAGLIHCITQDEFALTEAANPGVFVIEIPSNHEFISHQDRWYSDGSNLVRKTELVIASDKDIFNADAADICQITITPPANTNISINQSTKIEIFATDNIVNITSDSPRSFDISVVDKYFFSNVVTVRAI